MSKQGDLMPRGHQKGGAALEYLLVSTFATIATITILGMIAKVSKTRLEELKGKMGLDYEVNEINPFDY